MVNKAEDGINFAPGSLMFNHYDMKPVVVGKAQSGFDGWFKVKQYDREEPERWLGDTILDGSRMCSLETAVRYGFLTEEQCRKAHLAHDRAVCGSETDGNSA